MKDFIRWALGKLSAKKCRGCDDPSFHTHHMSAIGHLRYGGKA